MSKDKRMLIEAVVTLNARRCACPFIGYYFSWRGETKLVNHVHISIKGTSIQDILDNLNLYEVEKIEFRPYYSNHLIAYEKTRTSNS